MRPLCRPKFLWLLVHKRLEMGPEFLPTRPKFCILLHRQASHTEVSKRNLTKLCQTVGGRLRWCQPNKVAPHIKCKWNYRNYVVRWCPRSQKHCRLAMASPRAAFSACQYIVIATFSTYLLANYLLTESRILYRCPTLIGSFFSLFFSFSFRLSHPSWLFVTLYDIVILT